VCYCDHSIHYYIGEEENWKNQRMASKTYSNVGEFDEAMENWAAYMERMEQYFLANEVTTNNKK